ncbi:MAG: heavy metal translocating P-type ATPase metal-binding domain-containing protein, partial [Xanthomonadales bacterium]|nr:heavy metal translocating P-type ATPase metal-binding domain-containing protein [Xanthomonadales bacterium]
MDAVLTPCFHCGEVCPPGTQLSVERDGQQLPVCCEGCLAVSNLIFHSGLDRYYQFREGQARKADEDIEALGEAWKSCDTRQELWGVASEKGRFDLLLQTEGVQCAACAWLIRSRLEPMSGVERVQVDIGSGYTRIEWDPARIRLSEIALALAAIGYRPHLPLAENEERGRLQERREAMLRLGVAGLGMMQVMMYAVGLYAGEAMGISAGAERFLEWTSLLVTIPVVFYAGRPFFEGAAAGLRSGRMGMDVPVALAIGVAFLASCWNFLRGAGEVYFDSVVMFVFFLSAARFVQLMQRHRNLQSGAALARLLPEWAQVVERDRLRTVLLSDLQRGQCVRVRPGEPFPADGVLRSGTTEVDEALLTGEAHWIRKSVGDPVVGGSINQSQSVDVEVTATGQS